MADFTPGPWEARQLMVDGYIITKPNTYEIRTPRFDVATRVPGGGPFREYEDAIMAAAAPDLYAACKELLFALTEHKEFNTPEIAAIEKRADAAIAKADGKEIGS